VQQPWKSQFGGHFGQNRIFYQRRSYPPVVPVSVDPPSNR
jgi:hypothetical protein